MSDDTIADQGGTDPAATPNVFDGAPPLKIAAAGAYDELLRRVAASPQSFNFDWRGVKFMARLDGHDGGLRLTLHSDLTALPYSAENAGERKELLAVVDAIGTDRESKFRVVCGQKIVIEDSIDLTQTVGSTVNSIVTSLTILVLRLAPYLDLLAESASTNRERLAEPSG